MLGRDVPLADFVVGVGTHELREALDEELVDVLHADEVGDVGCLFNEAGEFADGAELAEMVPLAGVLGKARICLVGVERDGELGLAEKIDGVLE